MSLARHSKNLLAILLALMLVASLALLSGCKVSEVLNEKTEDPECEQIDENEEPRYNSVADAEEDETKTSSRVSNSEKIDDQKAVKPVYEETVESEEDTEERDQDDSASNLPATSGLKATKKDDSTQTGDDADGDASSETDDEGEEESDEATGNESVGGGDTQGGNDATGGTGGSAKIYDDGEYTELPEGVNSVAACGQYATIVQMLCGKGGLAAADKKWLTTMEASAAFADEETEGVSTVATGWSGDGSEAGSAKIQALIEAAPDCVLLESGSASLTEAEQEQLVAEGISVLVVPDLGEVDTADEDIVTAVNIVAELLKDAATTYDASAQAATYTKLREATLDSCLTANGGYSIKQVGGTSYSYIYQGTGTHGTATTNISSNLYVTAFVDSWTTATNATSTAQRSYAGLTLHLHDEIIDASEGMGLSAQATSDNFMLLDYYLQVSGVMNNAYDSARPALATSGGSSGAYMIIAGTGENLVADSTTYAKRSAPSALWFSKTGSTTANSWTTVGDVSYPALITRTEEQAVAITTSASRSNGLYNVGQSYEVWVLPEGLAGSWADGTVESFLAAPWAYCMFQLGQDLGTASDYVDTFYEVFYRAAAEDVVQNYQTVYTATCP